MEQQKQTQQLGPLLCWAVVFADIGTSIYYVPGILYATVGKLAGFFVFLTMSVFLLLTFKYVEVTYRFPQGGGVVTVASQALNRWFGALGGMFILVDYFLTAAISSLSGILYLSIVFPMLGTGTSVLGFSLALWLTLLVLVGHPAISLPSRRKGGTLKIKGGTEHETSRSTASLHCRRGTSLAANRESHE
ncbi:hypothetical protein KSD_06430 [Ktedonobacter sp. SOSP1-85]|uniref:amino acid permease n=1 Tax=Ktedonobacter sp. SOSP1-85 TaxID=2778367 RepID=UPI0019158BAC|nr:amino acid permease [Ktedonobacter sp. SOSP1-85]GHO72872.1 hypothetical protein KSD_06430 [Ktedonobacter sp. SOSP1-85]